MNIEMKSSRQGFSLIELLCVIAIIGALLGLTLPAVQRVRESSRNTVCQNKMRQVGQALHTYHSSYMRMPAGTLGYEELVIMDLDQSLTLNSDPANPYYFENQQNTSWIVQVLDNLELGNLKSKIPQICFDRNQTYQEFKNVTTGAPDWLDGFAEVREVSATRLPILLCPSDSISDVPLTCPEAGEGSEFSCLPMAIGAQPAFISDLQMDRLLGVSVAEFDLEPAATNYLGCTGAHSGSRMPNELGDTDGYKGVFRSRQSLSLSRIRDGASHTILIGESIGFVHDRLRSGPNPWFFGGLGRANAITSDWGKNKSQAIDGLELFGDSWYAYPVSFGSMHPAHVNFVNADGSVTSLSRYIDAKVLYSRCGSADGTIVGSD